MWSGTEVGRGRGREEERGREERGREERGEGERERGRRGEGGMCGGRDKMRL